MLQTYSIILLWRPLYVEKTFQFLGSTLDVYRLSGDFTANAKVYGVTSGAQWFINTESDTSTMDNAFEDIIDNNRIEGEADGVIDFTEHNPFGEP